MVHDPDALERPHHILFLQIKDLLQLRRRRRLFEMDHLGAEILIGDQCGGIIHQRVPAHLFVHKDAAALEILLHVGIDTVAMAGEGFSCKVKEGQLVKKGDLLLSMDRKKIAAAGHPATIITVLTNGDGDTSIEPIADGAIEAGEWFLRISR